MSTRRNYPVTRVTQRLPSGLLAVELPPGVSLDKYIAQETEKLKERYPLKATSTELGSELRAMYEVGRDMRNLWEMRYELVKLRLREEMKSAKIGMADGMPFVARRQHPVSGYTVDPYEQDALYPV